MQLIQAVEASNVVCDGLVFKLITLMPQNGCGNYIFRHAHDFIYPGFICLSAETPISL